MVKISSVMLLDAVYQPETFCDEGSYLTSITPVHSQRQIFV